MKSRLEMLLSLARHVFDVPLALARDGSGAVLAASLAEGWVCDNILADDSLCARARSAGDVHVMTNAATEPHLARVRFGPAAPLVRFHAGVPLPCDPPGPTLSLFGAVPRAFPPQDEARLRDIGALAARLLEQEGQGDALRALANAVEAGKVVADRYRKMYERCSALGKIGVWECDLADGTLTWTEGVYDIFELPRGTRITREMVLSLYEEEARERMERARRHAIETATVATLDIQIRTARGNLRWMRLTIDVETEEGRAVRIFGLKQDITQEMALLDRLRDLAECDPLTRLGNRGLFETRLKQCAGGRAKAQRGLALVLVDLDGFKDINDTYGHSAGDTCLKAVAQRLRRVFDGAAVIARIGGDEFAILLRDGPLDDKHLIMLGERAIAQIRRPVRHRETSFMVGASVGIAVAAPGVGRRPEQMFGTADSALYGAKKAGRNAVRLLGLPEQTARAAACLATKSLATSGRARPERSRDEQGDL